MEEILGIAIPTSILTGLVSWGTLKATVNGLVPKVEKIEKKVDKVEEKIDVVAEDVAYLKGRHALDDSEKST